MSTIDRIGIFRGDIVDRAIGESSGGFPQAVLQLKAAEMWDAENQVWIPWGYDECETIAYLVLFGKSGKPLGNARQLMKATGWDGMDFLDFQESDKLKNKIQWRMEENVYEGNTTIRCGWIDAYDAVPGKKVQKLDRSDIAALQAKYASACQALSGGPKPKAAPPAAPKQAPAAEPPFEPDPTPPVAPAGTPEPEAPVESTPPTPPAAPEPPKSEKPKATRKRKPDAIDMGAAWKGCFETGKAAGKTDVEITNIWTGIVTKLGGNDAVGKDWNPVKAKFEEALAS